MFQSTPQYHDDEESAPNLETMSLASDEESSTSSYSIQSSLQDESQSWHQTHVHQRRRGSNKPLQIVERSPSIRKTNAINDRQRYHSRIIDCLIAATTLALAATVATVIQSSNVVTFDSFLLLLFGAETPYADYSAKPQTIGYVYSSDSSSSSSSSNEPTNLSIVRFDPTTYVATQQSNYNLDPQSHLQKNLPAVQWGQEKRTVEPMSTQDQVSSSSASVRPNLACRLRYHWQTQSFPTCNSLHEQSFQNQVVRQTGDDDFSLGEGSIRQVWLMENYNNPEQHPEQVVVKALRLDKEWNDDHLNRDRLDGHRKDALISERLTSSPHVLDIYGACGNSALYEYASRGTLLDAVGAVEFTTLGRNDKEKAAQKDFHTWSNPKKMQLAYQVVSALADLQGMDGDADHPSVAHGDLDISQFVTNDGVHYKLSDFNGASMVRWNRSKNKECLFDNVMGGGKTRSPEEYAGGNVLHKIDNYALGNILFTLLTGEYPYARVNDYDLLKDLVGRGAKPKIPDEYLESTDAMVKALVDVMRLCWQKDPLQRPSAAELKKKLEPFVVQEV